MAYGRLKPNSPYHHLSHDQMVDAKRGKRMSDIDRLPPETRELIHEYGYVVVKALLDIGVTKPGQIRHVVETVLNEFSPTRGSYSRQGIRTEVS